MHELIKLTEPTLLFGHGQAMEDARDELTLFGPLDTAKTYGIRAGVIGTQEGIERFNAWVKCIQGPISTGSIDVAHPPFPGFEAVFGIPWNPAPVRQIEIDSDELAHRYLMGDRHQRVFRTVDFYAEKLIESRHHDDANTDIWFIIIPENVIDIAALNRWSRNLCGSKPRRMRMAL